MSSGRRSCSTADVAIEDNREHLSNIFQILGFVENKVDFLFLLGQVWQHVKTFCIHLGSCLHCEAVELLPVEMGKSLWD